VGKNNSNPNIIKNMQDFDRNLIEPHPHNVLKTLRDYLNFCVSAEAVPPNKQITDSDDDDEIIRDIYDKYRVLPYQYGPIAFEELYEVLQENELWYDVVST
jgi:hypothetical protein